MTEQNSPTREERWTAALCHTAGLTVFFGLAVPLIVYLTQKERSPFLKAQALQALIFQVIALLVYWLVNAGLILLYFGAFIPMVIVSSAMGDQAGWIAVIFFLVIGLIIAFSLLFVVILVPAYFIFVLVAAWRSGKGNAFRYPIIGAFAQSK